MRVAVIGATGNVGTSLIRALGDESAVDEIVGVARRVPAAEFAKTRWRSADIRSEDLRPLLDGVDAVIHLAWLIQPSRDELELRRTNVTGSKRVFDAVRGAGVHVLVYASSVGAYSAAPKTRLVDESWPTDGVAGSVYSRQKAEVERMLDFFERENPDVRVVRMRPALTFKREAASSVRRLFAGPLLPRALVRPRFVPLMPDLDGFRVQGIHADDVADAYRRALLSDASGAFNVAADPVLDGDELAHLFGARPVRVPVRLLRTLVWLAWRLRLQPTPPGWVDLALGAPLLDSGRAREVLGWSPTRSATEALAELLDGIREGAGLATPMLSPTRGGPLRLRELASGVGKREPR